MTKLAPSDRALLFPSWAAADALGQITLLSMPFILGMLVDSLGLGPGDAGLLLSAELCTIAVACMAVSIWVGRLPKRTLALCGAVIAIIGNALSIRAHDFTSLAVARTITGLGYGLAMAAGNAVVASAQDPAPLYDKKMMLFAITQLLVDLLVPSIIQHLGPVGFFGSMVVMNLLMIPLIARLPQRIYQSKGMVEKDLSLGGRRTKLAILLVLSIAVLFAIRESAYWGFLERFGNAVSVDAALVGLIVGIGTVPSIVAPRLATLCRERFGALGPTLIGVLLEGVVLYLISATSSKILFLALLLAWPVFYCYTVPLLMGVAAQLDKQGRVIALVAGALQIAFAIGPAVAGALVQKAGLHALGPFAWASTAALMLMSVYLPRRQSTILAPETA